MSVELTPREVDDLRFSVRADRMASSESSRLESTVEDIVAKRLASAEADLKAARQKVRRLRRKLRECRDGA